MRIGGNMEFKEMSNEDILGDLIDRILVFTMNNPNVNYEDFDQIMKDYVFEILHRMSDPGQKFRGFDVYKNEKCVSDDEDYLLSLDGKLLKWREAAVFYDPEDLVYADPECEVRLK